MKSLLEGSLALSILKTATEGLALFGEDFSLVWCNPNFKKQTWFGGALGGKNAKVVSLFELFEKKDHPAILELFNIAGNIGQAYDFQRTMRRGPMGSFPAELKFHRHEDEDGTKLVGLEIRDLSLHQQYDQLEAAHSSMRERVSDLMAAQAELHYSVRMNTISEIGADMAHSLINPVTMCRDIVERELAPHLAVLTAGPGAEAVAHEIEKVLGYLKNIEDLAVWFRKFSNPRLSDTQISNVASLVEDALILNMNRLTRLGIRTETIRRDGYNPFVLAVPVNLIMWLNAALAEIASGMPQGRGQLTISINGNADTVELSVMGALAPGANERLIPHALEKFARRLPASARFAWDILPTQVKFILQLACFAENERDEAASTSVQRDVAASAAAAAPLLMAQQRKEIENPMAVDEPCVLVVDDEKDIRRLLKRTFRNLGYKVIEACDGREALALLMLPEHAVIASRVRIIVSDVRMPVMSGIEFFKQLRAGGGLNHPFVFFSSNLVDPAEIDGAGESEGVHLLTKESDLDRLREIVVATMRKSA